jgi:ABC-type phosphate transport system substrate-binding protein
MARRFLITLLSAAFTLAASLAASAEPAATFRVIVHSTNPAVRLDKRLVADAFLKKRSRWENDRVIQPVDLRQKSSARAAFSRDILGRDVVAVRRYWAQLVFSGRGVPPPELATESEIIKFVAAHSGAIGYVTAGAALEGVKVVEVE